MTGPVGTETPAEDDLRPQILDRTCALLPRVLRREVPAVSEGTRLMEDLGLTSSTMLELMLELEESLEIQIDVEEMDQADVNTVGALADYVAGHVLTDE